MTQNGVGLGLDTAGLTIPQESGHVTMLTGNCLMQV